MIRSMTAFARLEKQDTFASLSCEIKSVNHRYLDISVRLPENLKHLEPKIRTALRNSLARGKIECSLRAEELATENERFELDLNLISELSKANEQIEQLLGACKPVSATDILKWPGVLLPKSTDAETLGNAALSIFNDTLEEFVSHREREGDALKGMINQRLEKIDTFIALFRKNLPITLEKHHEKLTTRLNQFLDKNDASVDQDRLEQELVIFAQKIDIEEELDRLDAHHKEVKRVLVEGGAVGRRLDFLMQELNREANTTGSKSANAEQSQAVVDLKVCIEQMREQIQNIE